MTAVLQSTIESVTVYRNGALVTRFGHISAPEGCVPLHMPGLPLLFVSESLRIQVQGGTADAIEELPALSRTVGRPAATEDERKALARERARLVLHRQAWQARKAASESIQVSPPSRVDADPVLANVPLWLAVESMAAEEQQTCTEAIQQINTRLEEIAREQEALNRRSEQRVSTRFTRTLVTTLTPDGSGAAVRVRLAYFIPGARWYPVYQAHVDTTARRVRLWMGARIAQATGEDWDGVPIAVSTAALNRSARIPVPQSWRIGRAMPRPSRWRPLPKGIQALFADYDAAPRSPKQPASPPRQTPPPQRPAPTMPSPAIQPSRPAAATPSSEGMLGMVPLDTDGPGNEVSATQFFAIPPQGAPMHRSMPVNVGSPPRAGSAPTSRSAPRRRMPTKEARRGAPSAAPAPPVATAPTPTPPQPEGELDAGRLLDYAWLRLAGPADRPRRGKLLPVTLEADAKAFIEERGGELDRYEAFSQACADLRREQTQIWSLPLPADCFDVRTASFHHRYPAGPAVDLPSSGQFQQVAILEAEADCDLILRTVPRQDPRAFRYARLRNPLARPLLPGPMQVYLDGAYTVTSTLNAVGAQGTLQLNLGVEEQLRVARNATYNQSERGMMFNTVSELAHTVHTALRSRLAAAVTVEVYERLPLHEGVEGIDLSLTTAEPTPTQGLDPNGNKADGALRWSMTVPAGGGADIRYQYTVTISTRKELVGGNRREP